LTRGYKHGTSNPKLIPTLQKFAMVYHLGIQPSEVDKMSASEVSEFMTLANAQAKAKSPGRKDMRKLEKIL
jgi:hypothetical protein